MFSKMNGLEKLLWIFGVLAILGGFAIGSLFGPGDPGDGYVWKATAYIGMLLSMASGLISGVVFMALSRIVFHLRTISEKLSETGQRAKIADLATTETGAQQTVQPSVWSCKKCGATNPMNKNQCKACAEYR